MTNRLAVVPATYVKFSTMVDGTLRVVLDIEPKNMADAIGLFSKPGAPVAIARLTDSAAVAADRQDEGVRPEAVSPAAERRPLSIAAQCALRCQEYSFQRFCRKNLADSHAWDYVEASGDETTDIIRFVRAYCGVNSRRDLAKNSLALDRWQSLEADYLHWQREAA